MGKEIYSPLQSHKGCFSLVVLGVAWFTQLIGHLHGEEIVQAEVVGIAPVAWNKRGGAANIAPRHKL